MTSKNLKSILDYDNTQHTQNNYEQFLSKKYSVPNDCQVVIKRGTILGENIKSVGELENNPFKLRQLAFDDVKSDIDKIYAFIETASDEIYDLVQFGNNKLTPDDPVFHLQAELIAENMFANLSSAITALPQKLYKQFLIRLNENFDDKIENSSVIQSQILPDNEIYDIIKSSLENLKTWFFDNIDSIFDELNDNTQKGFFSDIWDGITNFFNEIGNKINQLIQNTSSRIQTRSKIWMAFFTGYDKYQVIMSDNDNVCEKCQQMAGEFFDTSEAKIGINAPPFHPNCGCTIERKKTDANIDEPLTLSDPSSTYDRNAAIDYAKKWAYKSNPNFPSFDGDCANFISQCLLAGGFEMNDYWFCHHRENYFNPRALYKPDLNWNHTDAWSAAKEQYEYLKNSNIVFEEVVITGVDEITAAINDPENPVKVGAGIKTILIMRLS